MESLNTNNKTPTEILEILGESFEKSKYQNDLEHLLESIEIADNVNLDKFDSQDKATYYYFLGNAWLYHQQIKGSSTVIKFESEEVEKQIFNYRMALSLVNEENQPDGICQILTNMGQLFSKIGRIVEAQEFFNKCLCINPNFGMAIGNKGFSLFDYADVLFEPNHRFIFMQYSHKNLLESNTLKDVYKEARNVFLSRAKEIESVYEIEALKDFAEYDDFYNGLEPEEIDYKKWCARNRLFINPLNDVLTNSVIANDNLFTPTMILKANEKPIYQTMFNQLKQEYVSARFLLYESLLKGAIHFSDKDVILMDTLDGSVYSLALEKTKICFRICYSIFDKIAYFLNIYLGLGHPPKKATFRNIWFKKLDEKYGLNNIISNSDNLPLQGLFWLSKDLFEKDFYKVIEPEAKELADIRNFIEHKSFKIVEPCNPTCIQETVLSDQEEFPVTYEINRKSFERKTLKLQKLSRSAIMYLSYIINKEEDRKINENGNRKAIPVEFIELNNKYRT